MSVARLLSTPWAGGVIVAVACTAAAVATAFTPNVPFELGFAQRDLTGDGVPEMLRLTAVGPASDALDVTFTIESAGRTLFEYRLMPLTRTVGFDAGTHTLTTEEHEARLREFGPWFLADEKFQGPAEFLTELGASARALVSAVPAVIERERPPREVRDGDAIWREIQTTPVTIFQFSPGGDRIEAIAWSIEASRFYRLIECC
jgi:hypothetical protein